MNAGRWIFCLALIALVVMTMTPAGAMAQEHEAATQDDHGVVDEHAAADDHGGETHALVPTTTEYIYKWINFVMLIGVLYWLLVVPPAFVKENFEYAGLQAILGERSQAIVAARELAKEQKVQATQGLEASAARLASIEQEAAGLVAKAHEDAERDKARMIEEATAQAEAIRAGASRDMRSEVARAERDLKAHVANLVVGIATDLVKKNFSGADQDRLVRNYLDRLGENVS
jgi:F-type H+-transporting ATPase subunit b